METSIKILILNQPFDNVTGGGITLSNLFEGIDPDNIAVVCSAQLINSNTIFERSNYYYQLGLLEQKWIFPFSLLRTKNYSGSVSLKETPANNGDSKERKMSMKNTLVNDLFFPFIKFLGIHQLFYSLEPSTKLIKWIKDFEPTIIYAQAQNIQEVRFCEKIKKELKIPFIFHMMDDWVSLASQSLISKLFWKQTTERQFQDLLKGSNKVLSISDYMALEYKSRYTIESDVFHNPVDETFWKKHEKLTIDLSKNPTILYAGRVGLGIDSSLILMAKAVAKINYRNNNKVNFVIQTEIKPSWISDYEYVSYNALVPYSDLPLTFANADLLFLPYDFSKESIEFIKFSMPTKASEYMICGTPILILAPKDTAIVMNAEKLGWASVMTENSLEKLVQSLNKLLYDPLTRTNYSLKAKKVAMKYHSTKVVQERFFKILIDFSKKQNNE